MMKNYSLTLAAISPLKKTLTSHLVWSVIILIMATGCVNVNRVTTWEGQVLNNGLIELTVVPDIGGRIIQYKLGDYGFFWVNPELVNSTPPASGLGPDDSWLNYGGDKLWPAPQGWDNDRQWPGPPDAVLDGQPYACEVLQDESSLHAVRTNAVASSFQGWSGPLKTRQESALMPP